MKLPSRSLALSAAAAATTSLLAAPVAHAGLLTPERGGSPNADDIAELYNYIAIPAILVFLGVTGTLAYTLVKFRARKGAVPAQIHGNTRLEIGWTVGAAAILVVLSVVTFAKLGGIRNPPESDGGAAAQVAGFGVVPPSEDDREKRLPDSKKALNIKVNGQQYVWRFTYPDGNEDPLDDVFAYDTMVVPVGTTVTLDIEAQDVIHSWWIPELGGKADATPGYTNHTWFKATKPGVFRGQCAEFCGRNHANMVARVRAVPPAEFDRWLAQQKRDIEASDRQAAVSRDRLQRNPQANP